MNANLREVVWGLRWAESPRWYRDFLFVSDTVGKRLLRVAPGAAAETVLMLDAQPNGTWPTRSGLAVASMFDQLVLTVRDGEVIDASSFTSLAHGALGDMCGDVSGGLYLGDFGFFPHRGEPAAPGQILYRSRRGTRHVAADDLAYPNGLAIVNDERLVVAESNAHRLTSFRIASPGRLVDRRPFADLSQIDGAPLRPDGLWADRDDGIWIAGTSRKRFVRLTDAGVSETLDVSPLHAIACCIGGEHQDVLFLAVSEVRGSHESIFAALAAGDTEAGILSVSLSNTMART